MSIIYATIFLGFMLLLAWWEAELIKRGETNHAPKTLWMGVMFGMMFLVHFESYWLKVLIIIGIFVFEYFSMWDYILNFARKVDNPLNYKLFGKHWMKFVGLLCTIALIILYLMI
jgi:hypothetical protein